MGSLNTTPAGISAYSNDPNWGKLVRFLIGPTANGIGLDGNGSLLLLNVTSSMIYTGTTPIVVTGSVIHLSYTAPIAVSGTNLTLSFLSPLALSAGSLTLNYTSPFFVSGGLLSLAVKGALLVVGTALTMTTTAPLSQSNGTLSLTAIDPFFVNNSSQFALNYTSPIFIDGAGKLGVLVDTPLFVGSGGYIGLKYDSKFSIDSSGQLTTTSVVQTDSGEQSMTPTFAWTVGTAPTTPTYQKYRYTQVGNVVTLWMKVLWTNAGIGNSEVTFALPGGIPTPAIWSSNPNSETAVRGAGEIGLNALGGSVGSGSSALYKDGSGTWTVSVYESTTVAAKAIWATLTYYA